VEETVKQFARARSGELEEALHAAAAAGLPVGVVPLEHLRARVVASLVGQLLGASEASGQLGARLEEAWSRRTRGMSGGTSSVLSEHAWSLACERHPDLRVPEFDEDVATECFMTVYDGNAPAVERFIQSRFGAQGIDAEAIAAAAWAQVYDAYWSPDASGEFRGQARIATVVTAAARRCALQELGQRAEGTLGGLETGAELEDGGPVDASDPASEGMALEFERDFQDCLGHLPPKRRLTAHLLWVDQLRPSEVAERLQVSRMAISNHSQRASQALAECMGGKGHESWENAKKQVLR